MSITKARGLHSSGMLSNVKLMKTYVTLWNRFSSILMLVIKCEPKKTAYLLR